MNKNDEDVVEIYTNDLFVVCNKRAFASGNWPRHPYTHDIVIERKGSKRLIKLKHGDRILIKPR